MTDITKKASLKQSEAVDCILHLLNKEKNPLEMQREEGLFQACLEHQFHSTKKMLQYEFLLSYLLCVTFHLS